jgi:hypothetical protein
MWGRVEVDTGFWWRNLRERNHLEYLGINGNIILKLIFKNGAWTEFIWLQTGTGGVRL